MQKMFATRYALYGVVLILAPHLVLAQCSDNPSCTTGCFPPSYVNSGRPAGDGLVGGRTYNVCTTSGFDSYASQIQQQSGGNGPNLQSSVSKAISAWNTTLSQPSSPNALQFSQDPSKTCDVTLDAQPQDSTTGAVWHPSNEGESSPSTSGGDTLNSSLTFGQQSIYDQIVAHEFGHMAGLNDVGGPFGDDGCTANDTVMWYQAGVGTACAPSNCDQLTEQEDIYNCSGSQSGCGADELAGCLYDSWYCVCDPASGDCGCNNPCDPSCSNYDPTDSTCTCTDDCDASCPNYDPGDPACGSGSCDVCDPTCVDYDPAECGGGGGGGGGGCMDGGDSCDPTSCNYDPAPECFGD